MAGQARARGGPLGEVGGSSAPGGSLAGEQVPLPKAAGALTSRDPTEAHTHRQCTGFVLFCAWAGGTGGDRR